MIKVFNIPKTETINIDQYVFKDDGCLRLAVLEYIRDIGLLDENQDKEFFDKCYHNLYNVIVTNKNYYIALRVEEESKTYLKDLTRTWFIMDTLVSLFILGAGYFTFYAIGYFTGIHLNEFSVGVLCATLIAKMGLMKLNTMKL